MVLAVLVVSAAAIGARKRAGLGVSLLGLAVPWFAADGHPFGATLVAMGSLLAPFKAVELYFDSRSWPLRRRLWHFLVPFDSRLATFETPRFELRSLGSFVAHAAVFVGGTATVARLAPFTSEPFDRVLRVLGGLMMVYGMVGTAAEFYVGAHRLVGIVVPPIQRTPILARTIQELWSRRWNRAVGAWLDRFTFRPFARRGRPALGIAAAFVVSAAIHSWMVVIPLGLPMVLPMALFFVLQAPLLLLELRLGVSRMRPAVGRVWSVAWMGALAPLFLEPYLALFDL
jgi:hypothetical protein